jgi:hypothetical protein
MKVADLQQHLADLRRLLEASGARAGAVAELVSVNNALAPFRDHSLKDFAAFLVRAEAFSRGEVPVAQPKGRRAGAGAAGGSAAKATATDVGALAREIRALYDRAADPTVTAETINHAAGRLGGLDKAGLVEVAEGIDLKGMKSKTKGGILDAIRQRIISRKGGSQRAGLIDRPETPPQVPGAPEAANGGVGVEARGGVGSPAVLR